jgi:hypothetical protein
MLLISLLSRISPAYNMHGSLESTRAAASKLSDILWAFVQPMTTAVPISNENYYQSSYQTRSRTQMNRPQFRRAVSMTNI